MARRATQRPMTHARYLSWWHAIAKNTLPPDLVTMVNRFIDMASFRQTSAAWLTLSMEHIEEISLHGIDHFQQTIASRAYWGEKYLNATQIEPVIEALDFQADIAASEIFRRYEHIPPTTSIQFAATTAMMVDWADKEGLLDLAAEIYEPPFGNPVFIRYKGMDLTQEFIQTVIELSAIMEYVVSAKRIVEVGPGSGRVARAIRRINPGVSLCLVDIPPALFIARSVIGPDAEYRLPEEDVGECDIMLAIDCLHEMTSPAVANYFALADRLAGAFYFKCWSSVRLSQTYGINDYPVHSSWRRVFHEECGVPGHYFHALYEI